MAVVSVKERHQDRRSSYGEDGTVTHLRVYLVKTDDPADGTAVAMTADGLPVIGMTHPKDGRAKLSKIDVDVHEDSDRHFLWRGEYTAQGGVFGMPANPLDRPPDIAYSFTEATEPYFMDCSEEPKPVVNSAGDPF